MRREGPVILERRLGKLGSDPEEESQLAELKGEELTRVSKAGEGAGVRSAMKVQPSMIAYRCDNGRSRPSKQELEIPPRWTLRLSPQHSAVIKRVADFLFPPKEPAFFAHLFSGHIV